MHARRPFLLLLVVTLLIPNLVRAEDAVKKEAPTTEAGASSGEETSRVPTKPAEEPFRVTCSWVIISHSEAPNALPAGKDRSKEDARKRAEEALAKARNPEVDFAGVVSVYSDDERSKQRSGAIGELLAPKTTPEYQAIADTLYAMEVGQVSDIVECPMGLLVMMRTAVYSGAHILIQFKGSEGAKPEITRTKEEAQKLATEILGKASAEGADFAALAREHSDGPSGPKGGDLGTFGAGKMVLAFENAVARIKEGEVTGPVETQFGFHVIKRTRIEFVRASHIVVCFKGSRGATPDTTRRKEEAKALAEKIHAEVAAEGADFVVLAKKYSEGPAAGKGGDLGRIQRSDMPPPFSDTAFGLEVGKIAKPVETAFGFHVILRTE